jgi:hypothetical protein
MKTIMLMLMAVAATVGAVADEADRLTWTKLHALGAGEDRQESKQHLVSHGFSAEGADALIDYVKAGQAEQHARWQKWRTGVCADPPDDPEQLALTLEKFQAEEDAFLSKLAADFQVSLTATDQSRLVHMLDGSHFRVSALKDGGPGPKVRDGTLKVQTVIERLCK